MAADLVGAPTSVPLVGVRVHVTGVVQGVGFRPFVFGLAERLGLTGWVRNTSAGVEIELDGSPDKIDTFVAALRADAPPLARVDRVEVRPRPPDGHDGFVIRASAVRTGAIQPVPPDVATCPDCLAEMADPTDRRHRYPFINCTNCGPRYTIIEDLPYDRPSTTMAAFTLCPECAAEYGDPRDRRFHAQPVACPACGPRVWLEIWSDAGAGPPDARPRDDPARSTGDAALVPGTGDAALVPGTGDVDLARSKGDAALAATRRLLTEGRVVAVKGLGGFHLACDATSAAAVRALRARKLRVDKPFALMVADLAAAERHAVLDDAARALLASPERPIVLAPRREESPVVREVAPDTRDVGLMLPYTPLHHLLFAEGADRPEALVLTSGNLSEEPIATGNDEARERLAVLADAALLHDRPIRTRCDDSVVRTFRGEVYPFRRSRGYAPYPVRLPWDGPDVLAVGAELKNTFCLVRGDHAFLSHHIGDLENYETLAAFEDGVSHLERLFRIRPALVAHDLHPDYMATRYARERAAREGLQAIGVQHHHAHVAAVMADRGHPGDRPVVGLAFDGTGLGDDGAIWGGEVLLADYDGYRRLGHLAYVPLPGGDAAIRAPWRTALAHLASAGVAWDDDVPPVIASGAEERHVLGRQMAAGINCPSTSSMGRLFDAVAALAGVRQVAGYEAQAAIALESLVDPDEAGTYELPLVASADLFLLDPAPLVREVVADVRAGVAAGRIAARFHAAVALAARDAARAARADHGVAEAALSGGVWQNMTLLGRTVRLLEDDGFTVLVHRHVPTNDGGLALGQAAVARRAAATDRKER